MTATTVRPATEADVPDVLALIRKLAEFEELAGEVESTVEDLRVALFGPRPIAEAMVGMVDGEMAGFALFFSTYSTFAGKPGLYLEDIFVREEHRGRGIGTELIRAGAALAVARGCARYEWIVLDWNTKAIDFYAKIGAKIYPAWRRMRLDGDALRSLAGGTPR
jgi:GNAT superfamily N-acetyltransferase